MKKSIIKGSAVGIVFTGLSYIVVRFIGFKWESLTVLMYLYVVLGVLMAVISETDNLSQDLGGILDRIVVVVEGEELELKKLVSGEKYRVKGELEKL